MAIAQKIAFLDRDGVINKRAAEHEYIMFRNDFIILPGVYDAIRLLNEAGFCVYILSNQKCIARGLCTKEDIDSLHEYMIDDMRCHGAIIDGVYYCPHGDNECNCRKPKPGLFYKVEDDLKKEGNIVDKETSFMIGDSTTDIEAANAYGVRGVLIGSKEKNKSLLEAVKCLLSEK